MESKMSTSQKGLDDYFDTYDNIIMEIYINEGLVGNLEKLNLYDLNNSYAVKNEIEAEFEDIAYLHPDMLGLGVYSKKNDFIFCDAQTSIYGSLVDGVTYEDGSVYGIPYSTDTRGLWYNKEIFEQAGIATPWEPKTWQDILDACAIIKEKCPDVVPFWCNSGVATGEATSMQTYEMLLYGTGEQLLDENDKWIVSSENILKTLNFINDIYSNGYGPSLSKVLNGEAGNTSAREYMPNGKLAITLDGFWLTGNYKETGSAPWPEYEDVLDLAPMPTSEGQEPGCVTMSGGWALAVPELADSKPEAIDFIKHCMSKDVYEDFIIAQGNVATRTDVATDETYASQPFMEKCTELLEGAFYRPRNSQYSSVTTYIQSMVESVASGTSPEDAMAQFAADVTNSVGEENVVTK